MTPGWEGQALIRTHRLTDIGRHLLGQLPRNSVEEVVKTIQGLLHLVQLLIDPWHDDGSTFFCRAVQVDSFANLPSDLSQMVAFEFH
jgi:hypothetical protein